MRTCRMVFMIALAVCFAASASAQFSMPQVKTFEVSKEEQAKLAKTTAVIETKFGNITIKFFPDVAPQHVKNFVELAKKGFYDGTIFHRVIPGFMIQGGDPSGNGTGGPGYAVKAEFSAKPHRRGILSMARSANPDSAGSQFFIVVKDSSFLDGQYSVFGEVVSGMDVADKIVSVPRGAMDKPTERVEMKVKIVEEKDKAAAPAAK